MITQHERALRREDQRRVVLQVAEPAGLVRRRARRSPRARAPGSARASAATARRAPCGRSGPMRVCRPSPARGLRERDEQHAEIVRGRVLAVRDRRRVVVVDGRDDRVDRVAAVHDRVGRSELARRTTRRWRRRRSSTRRGASSTASAAEFDESRIICWYVEKQPLVTGSDVVVRERAHQDRELERARAGEQRARVPRGGGAPGREACRPDRRADAGCRAASAQGPLRPRVACGEAGRPSRTPPAARTPGFTTRRPISVPPCRKRTWIVTSRGGSPVGPNEKRAWPGRSATRCERPAVDEHADHRRAARGAAREDARVRLERHRRAQHGGLARRSSCGERQDLGGDRARRTARARASRASRPRCRRRCSVGTSARAASRVRSSTICASGLPPTPWSARITSTGHPAAASSPLRRVSAAIDATSSSNASTGMTG